MLCTISSGVSAPDALVPGRSASVWIVISSLSTACCSGSARATSSMPTRNRLQQARQQMQQPLATLRMVGDLQAPEQVVDRLQVSHRRFRLLALGEHVLGDHLRPGGGDEAADRRRRAHLHHLIGQALAEMLLQDLAPLGELQRIDRGLRRAQLALQLLRQMDVDPVEAAAEECRVRRRRPGHLFRDRAGERQEARQARILDPRIAEARPRRSGRAGARPDGRTSRGPSCRRARRAARRSACARSAA